MNKLKHFFVLALLLVGIFGFGQNPTTINGCLLNGGGANLANKTVTLRFDSMSMLPPMTVTTNANGCYSASVSPRVSQGMVTASTFNCLGVLVSSNGFFSPNSPTLTLNLNYCGTSGSCLANFTASSTNLTAAFTNTSTGINSSGTTFSWSFGDGSSSTLMSPSHTYRAPGTYTVCLTISNSSTNCHDTICKSVIIQNSTTGCIANFTKTIQGTTGLFISSSTGVGASTIYRWSLTPANGSTSVFFGPTLSTTNLVPGAYSICLTIFDSLNRCNNTKCDSFSITGSGSNTGCRASFTYSILPGSRNVVFNSRSTTLSSRTTYSWNFGDGTFGNGPVVTHIYPTNGVFWACLTIIDSSNGAICRNTICDSVRLVGTPTSSNCRANFTYTIQNNTVQFQNISMGGPGANYSWSFGDGTSSTSVNPSKTYNQSGIFRVCLTIFDSASNCRSDKCDTIRLGNNATTCSIAGYITRDSMNLAVNNARVRLYEIGNLGTALRQTVRSNSNGYYVFNGVSNGQYLVQAMADSTTPMFRTYLPTYFGNTSWWFSSNPIQVCPSRPNTNIHLIKIANRPVRPFLVRGHIHMGTRKVNSMAGYLVYLVNSNKEVIATAETDLNGEYVISNVDAGNYSVTMDVTGLTPASVNVVLGSTSPVATGIDFVINSTYILASVNQTQKVDLLNTQVYPNPIQNEIYVQFELVKSSLVQLTLVDVQGKMIQSFDLGIKMGTVQTVINSESLKKGVYFLRIHTDEGSNVFKLVK
jgi:PKD repeat protein